MIDTSYQFDFVNPRQSMNEPRYEKCNNYK